MNDYSIVGLLSQRPNLFSDLFPFHREQNKLFYWCGRSSSCYIILHRVSYILIQNQSISFLTNVVKLEIVLFFFFHVQPRSPSLLDSSSWIQVFFLHRYFNNIQTIFKSASCLSSISFLVEVTLYTRAKYAF